jgi:lipopolysaccharide export system permease protein
MLRIIDRYLLREVFLGWLAITLILWLILISHRMVRYLAQAAAGELPGDVIFILLGVKTLWLLVYIMPFSLALGIVMGLGRMYRDNEMAALGACGVGPSQLYRPLLGIGVVIAAILGWMALYVSPAITDYGDRITRQAEQEADVSLFGAGRFNTIRGGRMTFYAERLSEDKKNMENLFVYVRGKNKHEDPPQVISAASAYRKRDRKTGDEYVVFVDGTLHEGKPGDAAYRIMQFEQQGVRIELQRKTRVSYKSEIVPTEELLKSDNLEDVVELQWRVSVPLSVIVLVLLSVPVSRVSPRTGRYGGIVTAVLLFLVYYNLLGMSRIWVQQGVIPQAVGLWWVHLAFIALAYVLLNTDRLACRLRRQT